MGSWVGEEKGGWTGEGRISRRGVRQEEGWGGGGLGRRGWAGGGLGRKGVGGFGRRGLGVGLE